MACQQTFTNINRNLCSQKMRKLQIIDAFFVRLYKDKKQNLPHSRLTQ